MLYRYSVFSGDDPATPAYERFDPLLGGVQRDWLQGMVMVKMMNNANLEAHRVEVSVKPRPGMELLVDVYEFRARETNNLGRRAGRSSPVPCADLGYEITPTLSGASRRIIYIQAPRVGQGSRARHGWGAAHPRPDLDTFQASLYAGF